MLAKLLYKYTAKRPCRLIHSDGKPYLERYFVGQIFGYTLYLHRFVDADGDRALHDHPWTRSIAVCLVGGYHEKRLRWFDPAKGLDCIERHIRPGSINPIKAESFHQILTVKPGTWTLFMHNKKVKGWGFIQSEKRQREDGVMEIIAKYHGDLDVTSHKNWWETAELGADSTRQPQKLTLTGEAH